MQIKSFLPIIACMLASCAGQESSSPTLVASFYPLAFVAEQIAGDHFHVVNITPAGSEPHDYQLTPKGRTALEEAKLIFVNGLGMETWTDRLDSSLAKKTVALSDGIEVLQVEGRDDPHVWLDTRNYLKMGDAVLPSLLKADPAHSDSYHKNHAAFAEKIADLETKCHQIADAFQDKVIAVSHAAYGYLCEEFGITQLYINGLSPDETPQAQAIGEIIDAINEKGIDTIFFEELASSQIAEYIASQTGCAVDSLNPLEGLTQEQIDQGEDYFSVYLDNMRRIERANNHD